jgi:hypothetical protein
MKRKSAIGVSDLWHFAQDKEYGITILGELKIV